MLDTTISLHKLYMHLEIDLKQAPGREKAHYIHVSFCRFSNFDANSRS